jgi:thiamine-phosphate pyrophosphorylase
MPLLETPLVRLVQGGHLVQLRQKHWSPRLVLALLERLGRRLTEPELARVLVNDRLDIALCFPAVGLHLPESGLPIPVARRLLGPHRRLGVSCHGSPRLLASAMAGADLATLGPVFSTPGKGPPLGPGALCTMPRSDGLFLYALGGIDSSRLASLAPAGMDGVACIRAIFDAAEPWRAADELAARLLEVWALRPDAQP